MTESNRKKGNSFRRIFPNIFFSNKNKDKSSVKDTSDFRINTSSTSKINQYQNPRFVVDKTYEIRSKNMDGNDERIYENLSTRSFIQNNYVSNKIDVLSNHSSSSTLVSENLKNVPQPYNIMSPNDNEKGDILYVARPQVPPKPNHEILYTSPDKSKRNVISTQYPDVYYHSVEKLTDKISPLDEIEIYRASQAQAHPASVGAEIKKVSTKFLISPKKEAEVRTIQPIRARSLSLDKDCSKDAVKVRNSKVEKKIEKPYNYSAPTSPIAVGHKVPNMPTTVSPYERVRKNLIEAEEKRNSLNRSSGKIMPLPQPISFYNVPINIPRSPTLSKTSTATEDSTKKEKTRQKVEAFYWQKIKELKIKEDEYLLRQSIDNPTRRARTHNSSYSNSSSPTSFIIEPRSCSLPRGKDLNYSSQFFRGFPERRTDTYLKNFNYKESDIIYRKPENIYGNITVRNHFPNYQSRPIASDTNNASQQTKRLSFEENNILKNPVQQNINISGVKCLNAECIDSHRCVTNTLKLDQSSTNVKNPPLPPLRTTSVIEGVKSYKLLNNTSAVRMIAGTRSVCSESESGSETGEIQRIMKNNSQKSKYIHDILGSGGGFFR